MSRGAMTSFLFSAKGAALTNAELHEVARRGVEWRTGGVLIVGRVSVRVGRQKDGL